MRSIAQCGGRSLVDPLASPWPACQGRGLVWLIACSSLLISTLWLANPNYRWPYAASPIDETTFVCDQPYGADFLQEWTAGDMLLSGAGSQLYNSAAFDKWQHDAERIGFEWPRSAYYPAVYPPAYYCLVAPVAALPYRTAVPLWLCLIVMAYGASAALSMRFPWPASRSPQVEPWRLWCVGLLFPALFLGCVMGQKGTLWLLILVGAWQLYRADRDFTAGCVAALLMLKPTLAPVLVLAMMIRGQWRFCAGFATGAIAIGLTSLVLCPTSLWIDYINVVLGTASYQDHAGYRSGWSTSLITLFQSLGMPRVAVLSAWMVSSIVLMSWLARWPSRETSIKNDPSWLLAALLITALVSPHFYFYDLVWLVFPLVGMFARNARQSLLGLGLLWFSISIAHSWDSGWPMLSLALLACLAMMARPVPEPEPSLSHG